MEEYLLVRRPKVDSEIVRRVAAHYLGRREIADITDIQRLMLDLGTVRRAKCISQRKVAQRMQTQQSAVSDLENGRGDPQLKTIQGMARAIGSRLQVSIASDIPQFARFIDSYTYTGRTVPSPRLAPLQAGPSGPPRMTESVAAVRQPSLGWAPLGRIPVRVLALAA